MASHHRAEELMALADIAFMRGDDGEAKSLLAQAAEYEVEAFRHAPAEKAQTRGILAASAVALYRRANLGIQAERVAHRFLAEDGIPDPAREGLEEALHDLRAEQIERARGRTLTSDRFEWKLRGQSIGEGTAPMALISQKIDQIQRFAVRVIEEDAHVPLRTQQPVSERIRQSMSLVMGEPLAGSFRFALRLSVPDEQLPMFENNRPDPARIGSKFFEVLEAVLEDDQDALAATVPDAGYRQAFIHLVRNMVPDGRDLTTIQVTRFGAESQSTAIMKPQQRAPLDRRIRSLHPARSRGEHEVIIIDLLRGVELNADTVTIGAGEHQQLCRAEHGVPVIADVIEGMLDQPVRVSGRRVGRGFRFSSIVPATPEEVDMYRQQEADRTIWYEVREEDALPASRAADRPLLPGPGEDE